MMPRRKDLEGFSKELFSFSNMGIDETTGCMIRGDGFHASTTWDGGGEDLSE